MSIYIKLLYFNNNTCIYLIIIKMEIMETIPMVLLETFFDKHQMPRICAGDRLPRHLASSRGKSPEQICVSGHGKAVMLF